MSVSFCNGDFEPMPDDAGLGMQARRKMVRVISVAYALALAHAVIIVALGGLHAAPLALFGLVQLTPALAVLICDPGAFRRVVELISRTGGAGAIVQAWAVAAFAVAAPIAAAAALGLFVTPYGPEVPANYPLKDSCPGSPSTRAGSGWSSSLPAPCFTSRMRRERKSCGAAICSI